jgi:hypothetical protein
VESALDSELKARIQFPRLSFSVFSHIDQLAKHAMELADKIIFHAAILDDLLNVTFDEDDANVTIN